MTSELDNDSRTSDEVNEIKIEELKPRMKNLSVVFKVIEKGDVREVNSRHTGEIHQVADAIVGDSTAVVTIPLWDSSIENIEIGKVYKLQNGYTGLFRGKLQLKIGRHSTIDETEVEIKTINNDVDMSAEFHESPQGRHYYQSYGRSQGYSGYDRSRRRDFDRYSRQNRSRRRRW